MNKFLEIALDWEKRPAKWYEFWYPHSGIIGGIIFGCVISSPLFIIMWLR